MFIGTILRIKNLVEQNLSFNVKLLHLDYNIMTTP